MTTRNNPTADQHFVPRFYLKNFANDDNNLTALDIKNSRLSGTRHYSAFGYEKFYYAATTGVHDDLSQQVEYWLQSFEDVIARELPRIISVIMDNKQFTEEDKYLIAVFMALTWMRTPSMREQLNKTYTELHKKIMGFAAPQRVKAFISDTGTELTDSEKEAVIDMMQSGNYDLKFDNIHHLQFMTRELGVDGPGFSNMFRAQRWILHIAKGNERFVTSDSPVVEWYPPPKHFYDGGTFLQRDKFFSLTPEIMIELKTPFGSNKVKRKTHFASSDTEIAIFNRLLIDNAIQYVYSGDRQMLQLIMQNQNNPGPIEKAYYDQYRKPWHQYKMRSKERARTRR